MNTWLLLAGCIAVPMVVGFVNGIATAKTIDGWYRTLDKPSWTPPNAVFGPVWTVLYLMMGTALWLVIRDGLGVPGATAAAVAFGVQMVFNALWSPAFFLWKNPALALRIVISLDVSVIVTIVLFWRVRPLAGLLLVPYLAWGLFATALNGSIVRRNPSSAAS